MQNPVLSQKFTQLRKERKAAAEARNIELQAENVAARQRMARRACEELHAELSALGEPDPQVTEVSEGLLAPCAVAVIAGIPVRGQMQSNLLVLDVLIADWLTLPEGKSQMILRTWESFRDDCLPVWQGEAQALAKLEAVAGLDLGKTYLNPAELVEYPDDEDIFAMQESDMLTLERLVAKAEQVQAEQQARMAEKQADQALQSVMDRPLNDVPFRHFVAALMLPENPPKEACKEADALCAALLE